MYDSTYERMRSEWGLQARHSMSTCQMQTKTTNTLHIFYITSTIIFFSITSNLSLDFLFSSSTGNGVQISIFLRAGSTAVYVEDTASVLFPFPQCLTFPLPFTVDSHSSPHLSTNHFTLIQRDCKSE